MEKNSNKSIKISLSMQEIANLVEFLVSDKNSYITGQVINIDGGMVM